MPRQHFAHIRHWVFDLDNTLYPPAARLFDQIETRMTDFVMRLTGHDRDRANQLRHRYWSEHGTTLAGLMQDHDFDAEHYLQDVHDIDFSGLAPDPHLADLIASLPGKRIVYTNGSAPYAANVLRARGLEAAFDAIYGVEHAGYTPKPRREAFETVFDRAGVAPGQAAMFEDDPRNLAAPHAMGLATVHVADAPAPAAHIQFHTDDLSGFLEKILSR